MSPNDSRPWHAFDRIRRRLLRGRKQAERTLRSGLRRVNRGWGRISTVAITQDDSIDVATAAALRHFDLRRIVEGKRVAIKPNETWVTDHDLTAVTQPDTLQALVRQLKQAGPREIVVTGGAGQDTEDVLRRSGMMAVIEAEGLSFIDHNKAPFVEVALQHGAVASVMVNPAVLEYDALIALSQLKVHQSATVTLALKNVAMSYPAADYYGHPRQFSADGGHLMDNLHAFIAAMVQAFPIDLAVTVGNPAMVGKGPIGGHAAETGLVIASEDALAADVVGAKLLGFNIEAVRHLQDAAALGLGEPDLDKLRFPELSLNEACARFMERVYGRRD
ncbi:MAG TPA: DUF362 domain-containing protein [Dehalococcoidia bacterium]|nr:DUF362 domain-containing protein [Dehalococcoidia bacterium]